MKFLRLMFTSLLTFLIAGLPAAQAGWNGPPPNRDADTLIPHGVDVRLLFAYGLKYPTRWKNPFSPTGWSPTHHRGIDFVRIKTPTVYSKVISASSGKVVYSGGNNCDGGIVVVKTPHKVVSERGTRKHAFVWYIHLGKNNVRRGQSVMHGDLIGTLAPIGKRCIGRFPHLHFALSTSNPDPNRETLNPNYYWANGPEKFTCFEEGMELPADRLALTSPMPCEVNTERLAAITAKRPVYDGNTLLLSDVLKSGKHCCFSLSSRFFDCSKISEVAAKKADNYKY